MRTRARGTGVAQQNGVQHAEDPAEASSGLGDVGAADERRYDSFRGTDAATAVSALEAAVADPAVLVQPTAALADVMRTATKVRRAA